MTARAQVSTFFSTSLATRLLCGGLCCLIAACAPEPDPPGIESVSDGVEAEPHAMLLPNLREVAPRLFSGGEPHGTAAFAELQRMGIKTIVSVDGGKPDVAAAEANGLRYIHLPCGYDGIEPATARALSGLLTSAGGPVYVHCHHGKHRGPAAACIVAMGSGAMTPEQAVRFLETAGTGKNYTGLWRDVRGFPNLSPDTPAAPLVPLAMVEPLTATMNGLDNAFDRLLATAPPGEGIVAGEGPASLTLLVWEGFREAVRHLPADAPPELRELMNAAAKYADVLHKQFPAQGPASLQQRLPRMKKQCNECHAKFRDVR